MTNTRIDGFVHGFPECRYDYGQLLHVQGLECQGPSSRGLKRGK